MCFIHKAFLLSDLQLCLQWSHTGINTITKSLMVAKLTLSQCHPPKPSGNFAVVLLENKLKARFLKHMQCL